AAAAGAPPPHQRLGALPRHDSRLDAHLDGLVIAGDHGWQFALEELDAHPEPGETFAAAYVAFVGGNQARIARILKAAAADRANARAAASALGWLADEPTAADHALQPIPSAVAAPRPTG